jgi:plasmid stabilization system protein ParE
VKPALIHSAAKAELAEAIAWYEGRVKGLGMDLADEVETALRYIQERPQSCSPHKQSGFRKRFVRRFPYVIFFKEFSDSIWVIAVAHTHRQPDYWLSRRRE